MADQRSDLLTRMCVALMLMGRSTRRSPLDQWDTWVSRVPATGGVGWDGIAGAGPGQRMKNGIVSVRVTVVLVSYR